MVFFTWYPYVEVCSLRLDFEIFTIGGPADTMETDGGACTDTFVVGVILEKNNLRQIEQNNGGRKGIRL